MDESRRFQLTLNLDQPLPIRDVASTLRDAEAILVDIERHVLDGHRVKWEWGGFDVPVDLVAHPNGVSAAQLDEIVGLAQEGFVRARTAAQEGRLVQWPAEFGPEAQKRAQSILKRLKRIESITVGATGHESVEIRQVVVAGNVVTGRATKRVFSSVEGLLRMISGGPEDQTVNAGIREHGTGSYVTARFEASRWYDVLASVWGHRVIVEGRVAYSPEGHAVSIRDVTRIEPRGGSRSLHELEGRAPNLTGDRDPDDFVAELRGHG